MGQFTRFKDIPKLTPSGNWACDFGLEFLIKSIDGWIKSTDSVTPPLQMNPDFQRGHVWTEEQQIAYIEFLLRGGESGRDLYFNCPSWHNKVKPGDYNDFVCVDGLQRYTAIRRFVQNEIPAFGSKFCEYTDSLSMLNSVRVHINDLKSKAEVLRWYLEMNSGGTPHSQNEILRVQRLLDDEKAKEQQA